MYATIKKALIWDISYSEYSELQTFDNVLRDHTCLRAQHHLVDLNIQTFCARPQLEFEAHIMNILCAIYYFWYSWIPFVEQIQTFLMYFK